MEKRRGARIRFFAWMVTAVILTGILLTGILTDTVFGKYSMGCGGFGLGYTYPNADRYKAGNFKLEENVERLEINWISGSVTVKTTQKDYIYAEETGAEKEDRKMQYLVENGKLIIQFEKAKVFRLGFSGKPKDLTVYIPESQTANMQYMDVEIVSADLSVEDLKIREFDIETVSGEADLTNVEIENMKLESVSGDIEILGGLKHIDMESVSGNIKISSSQFLEEADVESVSGDIIISMPEGRGFTAELDTVSGDFNTDFEIKTKDDKKVYGDGSTEYGFETVSGDVEIRKAD